MIARLAITAAALFLLGASDDGLFTMRVAENLSPEALERRVLQAPQGATREVAVTDVRSRVFNYGRAAFEIAFAAAPAATKYPGLCAADVQVATFGPGGRDFGPDTPVRLLQLIASRRFAISVPALIRGAAPTGETCRGLGPVLWQPGADDPRYFAAYDDGARELSERDAWIAIRSLQRLTANDGPMVRCEEDMFDQFDKGRQPLCADRAATLKALNWASLSHLSSRSCGEQRICIMAIFDRPGTAAGSIMKVHVELSVSGIDIFNGEARNFGTIGSASIAGVTHVD